jgi:hypothetical protein
MRLKGSKVKIAHGGEARPIRTSPNIHAAETFQSMATVAVTSHTGTKVQIVMRPNLGRPAGKRPSAAPTRAAAMPQKVSVEG